MKIGKSGTTYNISQNIQVIPAFIHVDFFVPPHEHTFCAGVQLQHAAHVNTKPYANLIHCPILTEPLNFLCQLLISFAENLLCFVLFISL